jgi:hypothetical protein
MHLRCLTASCALTNWARMTLLDLIPFPPAQPFGIVGYWDGSRFVRAFVSFSRFLVLLSRRAYATKCMGSVGSGPSGCDAPVP